MQKLQKKRNSSTVMELSQKRSLTRSKKNTVHYCNHINGLILYRYPNRPHNKSKTLPFHELFTTLFNPLNENRKKPAGPVVARKKQGPHGQVHLSPNELRRDIIERFISRWRQEVGNDIYPAFRLIVPEKDRDRAMYGLKEKTIAKVLVSVIGIPKNSEDAFNLMNWKLPGLKASATAGDFAGRCFEVISKRPILTKVGSLSIAEVNGMLDELSIASKEADQERIMKEFYQQMNAEELMWLIRVILRQMKVGATERTFFDIWHPDAENLFNVSSSLRRVCWELYDPNVRLESDQSQISLMQCFQPQLAAFQMQSLEKLVAKMKPTEDDTFWIEEKLDGERMQLHMEQDETVPGGMRFKFWSRKAKDYTYLYGSGLDDQNSALTRHLRHAFVDTVKSIILDGEMITWDMQEEAMVAFGTLKTAALSEQRNPYSTGKRPLYRVFDCLFLNGKPITRYTLRDRRKALQASIKPVERRLEIHEFTEAQTVTDIEDKLREVVERASEGLVVKSPRSMYRLNDRNDDWIKVKPEYMTEFGEDLDCIVIGGYYGSGHRGGNLSSFLCGLRLDNFQNNQAKNPQKCWSFFKVGGGLSAGDYAEIRHKTEGKWKTWDAKKPPTDFIELGGHAENRQYERPDVWIKPEDSIVVSVKAASVGTTVQFRTGFTLRFPRFKRLRNDKDWTTAISITEFMELRRNAENEQKEKQFKVDDGRKQRRSNYKKKKPLTIAGTENDMVRNQYGGPDTHLFDGLTFFIISDSTVPEKKSKADLEQMIKSNGGTIVQAQAGKENLICIGEKRNLKARSIEKSGLLNIVKPIWLFDCIKQNKIDVGRSKFLLPYEPR